MPRWDDEEEPPKQDAPASEKPVETAPVAVQISAASPMFAPPEVRLFPAAASTETKAPEPPPVASREDPGEEDEDDDPQPRKRARFSGGLKKGRSRVKVGILGGKGVGKSYLFQSMVYRAANPEKAGVLSYYLKRVKSQLLVSEISDPKPRNLPLADFFDDYRKWNRLPPTQMDNQKWYSLRLNFGTGVFGTETSTIDIEFLDGSGEALESGLSFPNMRELWDKAFKDASVMMFCIPIWTIFPNSAEMTDEDWVTRDRWMRGFSRVLATYEEIRDQTIRVRSVLLLTMADDRRSALRSLARRWIKPVVADKDKETAFLKAVRGASGVPRYLASAREVSEYLVREFDRVDLDGLFAGPAELNFGGGMPWIVPVCAMDGATLDDIEATRVTNPSYRHRDAPIPAHVELPLLAALAEHHNALM